VRHDPCIAYREGADRLDGRAFRTPIMAQPSRRTPAPWSKQKSHSQSDTPPIDRTHSLACASLDGSFAHGRSTFSWNGQSDAIVVERSKDRSRRRVHSPSGIAAITVFGLPPPRIDVDRNHPEGVTGVETVCRSGVRSLLSGGGPQHHALGHLSGRDHAPQRDQDLAGQCHDHRRFACAVRALGS